MAREYKKNIRKDLKNIQVIDDSYHVGFTGRTPSDEAGIERVIQQVYKQNKDKIDSRKEKIIQTISKRNKGNLFNQSQAVRLAKNTTSYDLFAATVDEYIDAGYNVRDAVKLAVNSEGYTDRDFRSRKNLVKALKSSGDFDTLRRLYGWKTKFDFEKLSYDADNDRYVYGTFAYIYLPDDSPKDGTSPSFKITPFE